MNFKKLDFNKETLMSLKTLIIFATLVLSVTVALTFGNRKSAAAPATLIVDDDLSCPGATYPTISAAVLAASPGDTIKVCPGTYNELVNVNKQLTIEGAQAGVDARLVSRTGLPATESVVNGTAGSTSFYVTANNVTLNGFTVQNNTNGNVFGAGIVLGAGTSGASVVNNIVQNNIVGLYLANGTGNPALIQFNLFRNNTQIGPAGGHGIYSDQFVAGGPIKNATIDSNGFTGNTWGVGMSNTDTVNPNTNLTVSNNNFTANSRGMYFFATSNSSVRGNRITNSSTPVRYGIGFFGGDSGFTVNCNTIQNNPGEGIVVEDDLGAPNSNISINDNIIAGNATDGLNVASAGYTGTLNAERNWWGSPTGPTIASNPGGTGDKIIDPDGVVDYTPFDTSIPDADNDGIIDACDTQIGPPTNKDQCKNDGWKNYNFPRTFKNQGDCIQYVNTGK
jgi:nitrous oxidase accessory protein NosD